MMTSNHHPPLVCCRENLHVAPFKKYIKQNRQPCRELTGIFISQKFVLKVYAHIVMLTDL